MATITPQRQALEQQASSLIWGLVRANNQGTISDAEFSQAYNQVALMLEGKHYNINEQVLANAFVALHRVQHGTNTAQAVDALDRALRLDR